MNLTFLLGKGTFVFLFIFCFVISFSSVEAERTIRLRKTKAHLVPRHITMSARSGSGVYARRFSYGRPIPGYSTKGIVGRNRRNFRGRRRNAKREYGSRNYASGYRNWSPNRNVSNGRNNPRIDKVRFGPYKNRKEPFPIMKDSHFGSAKQKRRIRPHKISPMQRPLPPKKVNDFDEDYYYPEEAKRGETRYEFENRYPRPKKKRRNPGDVDKKPKKPDVFSKIPYYDEKPVSFKSKEREPPISYSTFIQHPPRDEEEEEFYEGPESERYPQQVVRNKKKRVKKKTTNSRKKNKEDEYYRPFNFEKDERPEGFFPNDEYELPTKTKKPTKVRPNYDSGYDDEFIPNKNSFYSKPRPQGGGSLFSTSDSDSYRGSSKIQESQFSPTYSQSWSNVVETTARPIQFPTENGFQPQPGPTQYSYQNRDYSSAQKVRTVASNNQQSAYYSQPDNTYKNVAYSNNYVSNQVSTNSNPQSPSNSFSYSTFSGQPYSNSISSDQSSSYSSQPSPSYSNSVSPTYSSPSYSNPLSTSYSNSISSNHPYSSSSSSSSASYFNTIHSQPSPSYSNSVYSSQPAPSYSQPVSSVPTFPNDVTVQKSVPVYDNTETFYNFNNNAYVNSQSSKYYDSDSQKYSNRLSSYRTNSDKLDSDDFIKKHQNLYNNGLSGVPVQGDGFGKDSSKKDFDIGYGDFQFDENPSS